MASFMMDSRVERAGAKGGGSLPANASVLKAQWGCPPSGLACRGLSVARAPRMSPAGQDAASDGALQGRSLSTEPVDKSVDCRRCKGLIFGQHCTFVTLVNY